MSIQISPKERMFDYVQSLLNGKTGKTTHQEVPTWFLLKFDNLKGIPHDMESIENGKSIRSICIDYIIVKLFW
jgi:hypothetical protein